jgi:hypothetical protein
MSIFKQNNTAFPQAQFNKPIDSDPQIVHVPLATADFGSRKSALPKSIKAEKMAIRHVPNKG